MSKLGLFLAILSVAIGSQVANAQLGGWFRWNNTQYEPTSKEYSDVVKKINSGDIKPGIWYQFPNGEKYQVLHPQEWVNLIWQCYREVDQTITFSNLPEKIEQSDEVIWGDDLKNSKNFYWSKNGTIEYVPNYSGKDLKFLVWKGYAVLKRKCGNPQGSYIFITPPTFKSEPAHALSPVISKFKTDTIKKVFVEETISSYRRTSEDIDDNYYAPEYWVTPIFYIGNCRQYGRPFQVANIRSYQNNSHYACAERRSNNNGGRRLSQSQPHATGPGGRGDNGSGSGSGSGSGGRGDNATTNPANNAGGSSGRSSYVSHQTFRSQSQVSSRPQYSSSYARNFSAQRPTSYSGNHGGGGYSSAPQHQQSYSGSGNAGHAGSSSRGRSR
jgi:uncharacterized membrane protein YgcG